MIETEGVAQDYGVTDALLFKHAPESGLDGWFRVVGVVHLYSASGIHLLALYFWMEWMLKALGLRFGMNPERIKPLGLLGFGLVSFWVWRIEGFHFSLFRPLISILLRALLRQKGAQVPMLLPLGFTFLLEWVFCLSQGFSPGALHYYLAVGGSLIAISGKDSGENLNWIQKHLKMSVFSWVPIAMLDLIHDHLVAPFTPILSMVTVPIVSLVLYPLTLLSYAFTGQVLPCVRVLWEGFMKGLVIVMSPLPLVFTVSTRAIGVGLLAASVFFLLRRLPLPALGRSGVVLIPLILVSRSWALAPSLNRVIQWDVGQGDAALIQRHSKNEVIDVGSGRTAKPDLWLRRLTRAGVTGVDGLLLSHLDEDHRGGLQVLLSVVPVRCIQAHPAQWFESRGQKLSQWIESRYQGVQIKGQGCIQESRVAWFKSHAQGAKGNEIMAGLVHEMSTKTAYFALGDGDQSQELKFESYFRNERARYPERIWKVSHHGSRFSSGLEFLKWLDPKETWISVGKRNPYHHPHPDTLARLGFIQGRIRRTDQEGDLSLEVAE